MTTHKAFKYLFIANAVFILVASTIPPLSLGSGKLSLGFEHVDKIGHFLAYFTLSMLFCLIEPARYKQVMFVLCAIAVGVGLEYVQARIPGRDKSVADAITNTAGLCCGVVFACVCRSWLEATAEKILNAVFRKSPQ